METITRISSGICETPTGDVAIVPTRFSGQIDGKKFFTFRNHELSPKIRVQWEACQKVIVVPKEVASSMITNGYAVGLDEEEVNEYNAAVNKFNVAEKTSAKADKSTEKFASKAAKDEQEELRAQAAVKAIKDAEEVAFQKELDAEQAKI